MGNIQISLIALLTEKAQNSFSVKDNFRDTEVFIESDLDYTENSI